MLPPTAKRRRFSRKQLQRSVTPGGASAAMRWPSALMTQLLVQGEPAPVRSHQDAAHDILARGRDGRRSQRAARRRHTDQRVVRRLDPLEVTTSPPRQGVSGEATEADRLDSRALLETEHEVRVVRYAVRTSASFCESASSWSWTSNRSGRRCAGEVSKHVFHGDRENGHCLGFFGTQAGQKHRKSGRG